MLAAHLGVVDETQIDNMSFVFFEDVLAELGHKLHYDAVVNYAGNSFFEKSWQLIADSNPLNIRDSQVKGGNAASGLAGFLGSADIKIVGG